MLKNISVFPESEQRFLLTGPKGKLEVVATPNPAPQGVAVICHPHPLHQGSLDNKVVYTLFRAFQEKNLHTVRFNFRGVGLSEGEFGNSVGETEDLITILEWVKAALPQLPLYLAGFSFGAYIAAQGALYTKCRQLYGIAPSVKNQPYDEITIPECPWIVVQGEQDEVVEPQAVYDWIESCQSAHPLLKLVKIPDSSHFFHGKLTLLRTVITDLFLS